MDITTETVIGTSDAARMLNCTPATVISYAERGLSLLRVPKGWITTKEEVLRFVARHNVQPLVSNRQRQAVRSELKELVVI